MAAITSGLICAGDRGVPAVSKGQAQHALAVVAHPLPTEPVGEQRWTQMRCHHVCSVQQPLGDPMFTWPVVLRFPARRTLRHVHHRADIGLGCGLREDRGGLQQPGRVDRIAKVRRGYPHHGRAHRVEVEQITVHHFGAQLVQPRRAVVQDMHARARTRNPRSRNSSTVGASVLPVAPLIRNRSVVSVIA